MTATPQLIGVVAGLVAAVLYTSLATRTLLAVGLFALSPLPILLAGFGWGVSAAQLAFLTSAVLVGIALGLGGATSYAIAVGVPSLVLSHLMLLHRVLPPEVRDGPAQANALPSVEWYPAGRIIAWTAFMAGVVVAAALGLFGDIDTYRKAVREMFPAVLKLLQPVLGDAPDQGRIDRMAENLAYFTLPVSAAVTWLLMMLANVWLAAKSAAISGQLTRPWPALAHLDYPPLFTAGLFAAIGFAFMPGLTGIMAMGFVGAFSLAFLLMGLMVIHVLLAGSRLKHVFLTGIYLGIVINPWVAPAIVLLGLAEPFFELRRRALQRSTPPENPGGA